MNRVIQLAICGVFSFIFSTTYAQTGSQEGVFSEGGRANVEAKDKGVAVQMSQEELDLQRNDEDLRRQIELARGR